MIDVLYFAWVRERIGLPRERVETTAATVADLVAGACARGKNAMRRPLPTCRRCGWRWIRSWRRFRRAPCRGARGGLLSADDRGLTMRVAVQSAPFDLGAEVAAFTAGVAGGGGGGHLHRAGAATMAGTVAGWRSSITRA